MTSLGDHILIADHPARTLNSGTRRNEDLAMSVTSRGFWSHSGFSIALVSLVLAGVVAPMRAASDQKSAGATTGKAEESEAPKPVASQAIPAQPTAAVQPGNPTDAPNATVQNAAVVPAASAKAFTIEGTDLGRMLHRDANAFPVRNRDGSMKLDLQGGYRNVLVVRITPDGKPEVSCIATEQQAQAVFAPAPKPALNKTAPDAVAPAEDPTVVPTTTGPKEHH
jgi:hypothetical protein